MQRPTQESAVFPTARNLEDVNSRAISFIGQRHWSPIRRPIKRVVKGGSQT